MTSDEARALLKQSIDPVTMIGIASAAAIGAGVGLKHLAKKYEQIALDLESGIPSKGAINAVLKHLPKKASHDSKEVERGRHMLHKMVRPIARKLPYKTKGAKGWDVMVDAVLSDSQSTGASSGR